MGFHSLTFMGRALENMKQMMWVEIMNNVNMISMNIMKIVGTFKEEYRDEHCLLWLVSRWTLFIVNSA